MSQSLGTVYVEINLDKTKFEKRQQQLLSDIKKITSEVEGSLQKSFQNLGVKTDNIYRLMANNAIVAYERIAKAASTTAAEEFRSRAAMVAKINSLNVEKAQNPLYDTLGVKSQAMIEAQRAAVMASYDAIKKSGTATAQDLINIERAKNDKLKALNKEMVGDHEMSMAAMVRSVLRFYAAFYVVSTGLGALKNLLMGGVEAIDSMKISAIGIAAQITSMQGTTGNVLQNYKENLKYAQSLVPVLEEIDAKSFANAEQIQIANRAMALQGVILDANKKKQVEAFTALTNAIALMTAGQPDQAKQFNQEMRAIMTGQTKASDLVAQSLDQMIKRQGVYKEGLKELVKEGNKHGDTLERLQPYLVGIAAASGDISQTWAAVGSSVETAWNVLQRELFKDAYRGIIELGESASAYVKKNAKDIADTIKTVVRDIFIGTTAIAGYFALASASTVSFSGAVALMTKESMANVSLLTKSFAIFASGILGYELGEFLYNEFESIRIAGVAMVYGLATSWDWLVSVVKKSAEYISFAVKSAWNPDDAVGFWNQTQANIKAIDDEYKNKKKFNDEFRNDQLKAVSDVEIARKKAEQAKQDAIKTPNVPGGVDLEALEKEKKARDEATNASEKHAEQVAKTIADLEWQLSIINKTAEEQKALNAVRSAGVSIDSGAGQKIYDLTIEFERQTKAIEENNREWAKYANFLSDEDINEATNLVHEGQLEAQDKNLRSMEEYNSRYSELVSDSADKTETAWVKAAENIQDAWSGLLTDILMGEFSGVAEFADGLGKSFASSFSNQLSAGITEGITVAQKTGTSLLTGAAMGAASGFNPYMLAGSLAMTGISAWMDKKDEPSYGEILSDGIKDLIDALKENTQSLLDQIKGTTDLSIAIRGLNQNIYNKEIGTTNNSLSESFKIPEGMAKRGRNWGEAYKDVMLASLTAGTSLTKDKGYTSYDFSKDEVSGVIERLAEKMGLAGFLNMMKATTTDAGALIDALRTNDMLNGEIPERVLKYYSEGGGSKDDRNRKVAGGVVEQLINDLLNVGVEAQKINKSIIDTADAWDSRNISEYAKVLREVDDTLGENKTSAKDFFDSLLGGDKPLSERMAELTSVSGPAGAGGAMETLIKMTGLSRDELLSLVNAEETYNRVRQEKIDYFAEQQRKIIADMDYEIEIASGNISTMLQQYKSIDESGVKWRDTLVDQGMEYIEAGDAARNYSEVMKEAAKNAQLATDMESYAGRILQAKISRATTLNSTDELQILNQELINSNRKAEVQALMDTYKAGTPAYQAMIKLAQETWGFEDAANNATKAIEKAAEAMEGMWQKDGSSAETVKGWWLQINDAFERTFKPTLFLDSLGLGRDSGLEGLLSATTEKEVEDDLRELITLWQKGLLKEEDAQAIYGQILSNASDINQNTKDLKASLSQQREVGRASQDWYDSFFSGSGVTELDTALQDAKDTLEDFRQQIYDLGGTIKEGWEAGGTIEQAVADAIKGDWLTDFRAEFADATQSSYMQSKASISTKAGDWEKSYLAATEAPDVIASKVAAINSQKDIDIQNAIRNSNSWLEAIASGTNNPYLSESDKQVVTDYYMEKYNESLKTQGEEISKIEANAKTAADAIESLLYSEEELATIRNYAAEETRKINLELLNNIRGEVFNITGDTDILLQQLIDLDADWMKVDAQDYGAQYDILSKQNDILTQLRDIQKEQLEETISNYNALQDVILDLQGGSLAPVQSKEFFEKRYDQLYSTALETGKSSDVNNLTGFINQYADFMSAYGDANYRDFTEKIISDFEALQSDLSGGATLDDLNAQLAALNSAESPIVKELTRIGDILAGMTGSGAVSQALAYNEQDYLAQNPDVAAAVAAGVYGSGLEHWQKYGEGENRSPLEWFDATQYLTDNLDVASAVIAGVFQSAWDHFESFGREEGRLPGFARGGSFIAGDGGVPEIVNIGSGSSARIFNGGETAKIIADAVSKAIGGAIGGGGNIKVEVNIDGKALEPRMVKVIQTSPEAHKQIKRVANG